MEKVTVLIQVHNEEKHIGPCIEAAKLLTNSIIVTDMDSTDKTVALAKEHGAQVLSYGSCPQYVEPAREFGIRQVSTKWVMILDADERMTLPLAKEIKQTIQDTEYSYFKIPRANMYAGKKWLKHGGWWPDRQMRLINTKAFMSWPANIHSTPVITGKMGHLQNHFEHLFHGDLETMVGKTLVFEDIESELLYKAGKTSGTPTFFRKFFGELNRRLIIKKGFMDGEIGIIESVYQAFSKTITYLFLYEKRNKPSAQKKSGSL